MNKTRVLVTGVAGFIGSNLADRLIGEGYEVVGIDNLSYGIREQVPGGVEFHELDIRSRDIYPVVASVEAIFHLAAKNQLQDCQKDPVETMDINVVGTANIFEAVRLAGGNKRLIYAQSSAIEEGDERLKGFYAMSKLMDQMLAEGYEAAYGIKSTGLRYFNVYGQRQDYRRSTPPIMSKLMMALLKGEKPLVFEGDEFNKRDFIHVDDINDFHLQCLQDERTVGKMFRLGSGVSHSVVEVLDAIQKVLGTSVEPEKRPRPAGDLPVATLADISEAKALGWSPKTNLEEGLKSMAPFIKAEIERGKMG